MRIPLTHHTFRPNPVPCGRTRREFLWQAGAGFAGLGLLDLLLRDGFFAAAQAASPVAPSPLAPRAPHFPTKAEHVIFLFMNGAPSQVDTFDPKPELAKHHGQPYAGKIKAVGSNGRPVGYLMQSPFEFREHGRSGLPISSLFPHTSKFADDLCVLRSLYTDTAAHASGCLQMNTGSIFIGRPSLGAWLSYGLGTMNAALPSFVVMTDPRGGPIGSASNWTAGYMPAAYQGTLFRSKGNPLLDLATPEGVSPRAQRRSLDLLAELNEQHRRERPQESELAYQMQTSAAGVVDLKDEPAATRELYGLDHPLTADFGSKCLVARRLIEKGVRFVQLYSGGGHLEDTWDGHSDCIKNHTLHAGETDRPIAALIADLKRTGLWDETLLVWGGEFGRTSDSQGSLGRDHNPKGFTIWLAGGGVRGGVHYGSTCEFGYKAVENKVHGNDLHATILHLLGMNHEKLTYRHNGRDYRLTDVGGNVIRELLA